MSAKRCAVLVLSCDKYSDLWKPFFLQFKKNFPSINYPLYLGSNHIACDEPGVTTLFSSEDYDWSSSNRKILSQIPEEVVFVILEDLLLYTPISDSVFKRALTFFNDSEAKHLKYWASPKPDQITDNPLFGEYEMGAPFRATVCGFWDKKYLMNLLIDGENPWNFEIHGSYRCSYDKGFYGFMNPLCGYKNMIEKGVWIASSVKWALESGIPLELHRRELPKGLAGISSSLKMIYFRAMLSLPWKIRLSIMNTLRKAFISY